MEKQSSNKRIRMLINELGITQTEFCQKTGITKSALSNYLNGDRTPRQDQISKIAEAYNINPSWLMGYNVQMDNDLGFDFDFDLKLIETNLRVNDESRKDRVNKYSIMIDPEITKIIKAYQKSDDLTKAMVRRTLGLDK